jgi:hypothetical protein
MRIVCISGVALLLVACSPGDRDTRTTPLPTKQAIDSVSKKLDAAAQDTERRRQEIDQAAK